MTISTDRLPNGVRVRVQGNGDPWAEQHRLLGRQYHMEDVDAYMGFFGFAANTGDRFFQEYVPDQWENRNNAIRNFAVVALFDRKSNLAYALSQDNVLTRGFYLWQCRNLAIVQALPPKFFYITDAGHGWLMTELDICTGKQCSQWELPSDGRLWRHVWDAAGLTTLRNELSRWLVKRSAA